MVYEAIFKPDHTGRGKNLPDDLPEGTFRRIELEFFLWRETIDRLVGEYNVQKAEEGLEHESITNTCTDAGAKPGLF